MSLTLLDSSIAKARSQASLGKVSLWSALLMVTQLNEKSLKDKLWQEHGIAVTSSEDLDKVRHTLRPLANDMLALTMPDGMTWLACQDPWSDAALAEFTSRNDGQTALALLQSAAVGTPKRTNASERPAADDAGADVVEFVNRAIAQASEEGASDIHFETHRGGIGIKYRLDGVMVAGARLESSAAAEQAISRIKVLAELDITDRRKPQDGRIRWIGADQKALDLRVSIMPSVFGEDAVLRLLDKAQLRDSLSQITLDALGFEADSALSIRELAARPHGMLLVTGPTGSGKTTTLYATLSEVNTGIEKIVTIEDPVEYELNGVLQIPVNERKGLTFATGLRSILRHDPDRIFVGEIRDAETAEIAVQAALTGHVVFTTVHANSLFDVLGRFQHFDIDPFAFASSLNGVVVQRLLRKLCTHCHSWRELTDHEKARMGALKIPPPERVSIGQGCLHCRQTGYKGRFVVSQVHTVDDGLRDLILKKSSILEIKAHMQAQSSDSLLAQAIANTAIGKTSLEEVTRVVGWT
ncbi:MAG: GspE/PulE family protein [Burkholderiaceae bacterium]